MNELTVIPHARELADITRDIRVQTGQFLRAAIEIGRLLYEAKDMVPSGGWGKYIEEELPFSHSWANNYMKLYREYGSDQLSLFDSQSFGKLRPTQALELLALPAEDRAAFVEAHAVESMSTRDLHRELQQELERTKEELKAQQDKAISLEATESSQRDEIEKLRENAAIAEKAQEEAKNRLLEETNKAANAEVAEKQARQELEKLKKNPKVPEDVLKKLRLEAQAVADKKAQEASDKALVKLKADLAKAEEAKLLAEEALRKAQSKAVSLDSETAAFKVLFTAVQEAFAKLTDKLHSIEETNPDMTAKLRTAVKALLDKLSKDLT